MTPDERRRVMDERRFGVPVGWDVHLPRGDWDKALAHRADAARRIQAFRLMRVARDPRPHAMTPVDEVPS